jgi:hypothetical protein
LNDDVGFSEIFLEEHDIGIDMLTKIQPNPVWHLRDKIKTPVHCELALADWLKRSIGGWIVCKHFWSNSKMSESSLDPPGTP